MAVWTAMWAWCLLLFLFGTIELLDPSGWIFGSSITSMFLFLQKLSNLPTNIFFYVWSMFILKNSHII